MRRRDTSCLWMWNRQRGHVDGLEVHKVGGAGLACLRIDTCRVAVYSDNPILRLGVCVRI